MHFQEHLGLFRQHVTFFRPAVPDFSGMKPAFSQEHFKVNNPRLDKGMLLFGSGRF